MTLNQAQLHLTASLQLLKQTLHLILLLLMQPTLPRTTLPKPTLRLLRLLMNKQNHLPLMLSLPTTILQRQPLPIPPPQTLLPPASPPRSLVLLIASPLRQLLPHNLRLPTTPSHQLLRLMPRLLLSRQPTPQQPLAHPATTRTGDDASSTASENNDEASSTAAEKNTRTTARPVTSTHVAVVTRTNSDGDLETMTTTSVSTSTPGLSDGGDDGSSSGMSAKTRNTVIGVVVGIGGAIVVGALGLVAWRIWGRKKHQEEADGLMDFNENNSRPSSNGPYHSVEKTEYGSVGSSGPQRSPFQSTLDTYHQPTPVNASSNF
ncbi:hypothetical protein FOXG_03043 [Fusarium oxysporum f. sp. lycopersici 4287]|uniref:Mid2 domain-containing protein n=1 Tax=Fusarium oxysporum f. sp. lycopersici (strain 4287 / CBS 123668 / FGSC 9935 / NRRL 34936) TaxID=426428 RepID=A0A0J9WIM6_FUSO4|nr:hypothetical protein FOXG_03043 [Fusarium oxysporum f. sp. lycopersici 4287]KNA98796.1 hypothetical protein FOXG_03043 [Fusarium oxysporum f. sp. lycopersici 4287]